MKVTLPYQVVLVCRSENEKTPVTVLPYEIEILKVMHGDDIRKTDAVPPVKEVTFETEDEYPRLQQYYKGNQEVSDPVRQALGTLKDFEESFKATKTATKIDDKKEDLLEKALGLGVDANKTWGVAKLQAAITEAESKHKG